VECRASRLKVSWRMPWRWASARVGRGSGAADGVFRVLDGAGSLIALYGPARPDDEGIEARAVRVLRPWREGNSGEAA